jgi:peptidoglycan/LPS O-acetylase OafA/YrhL
MRLMPRRNSGIGDCRNVISWRTITSSRVSTQTSPPGWLLLIGSIALAALLLWLVDYPIDRWRQRRVEKFQRQPQPAGS